MLSSYPDTILISSASRNRRSETIADHIRNLITDGQLKPGTRLPTENQLCRHYQVSRTTLREATQMLRTSGLLDVTPGRGSFVRLPDVAPLLNDLALAARNAPTYTYAQGGAYTLLSEACFLIPHLLTPFFGAIATRPESMKHALLRHVIQPKLSAEENLELENAWFATLTELARQNLCNIPVQLLLGVIATQRQESLRRPDTVLRQRQLQLRCSNALIEGEADLAARVMQQYFSALPESAAAPASLPGQPAAAVFASAG